LSIEKESFPSKESDTKILTEYTFHLLLRRYHQLLFYFEIGTWAIVNAVRSKLGLADSCWNTWPCFIIFS